MTTHLRARMIRAGACLALVGGFVLTAPGTASAADPTVQIRTLSSANLRAGERATMVFRVTNNNTGPQDETAVDISVTSDIDQLACEGQCDFRTEIPLGQAREFTVTLVAGNVAGGQTQNGRITVRAQVGGDDASTERGVSVRAQEQAPQVREVRGRVRDSNGNAVAGAVVGMLDSQNHQYDTTSNRNGEYRFASSDRRPITPGLIVVGARKDGLDIARDQATAQAGQSLTINLTMRGGAAESPSPTPSASVTVEPTDEVTEEPVDESGAPPAAGAVNPAGNESDSDSGSMLFLILGGLLVAAGIGAIVLLLMRRKGEDGEDESGVVGAGAATAHTASHGQGRYGADPTRVAAGRPADPTMLTPGAAVPRSLAEAPTMLQAPIRDADEFADPYGAPAATQPGGYGAAAPPAWGAPGAPGAYGAAGPSGYGAAGAPPSSGAGYGGPPTQYGRPPMAGGAYGSPVTGADPYAAPAGPPAGPGYGGRAETPYGAGDRYDEPTGRYQPPNQSFGSGYEDSGGFRPADPAGGYGQGSAYPPAGRGPAGPPAADDYAPGYPASGYPPAPGGGGYHPGSGGYGGAPAGGYAAPAAGGIDSGNAYDGAPGTGGYGGAAGAGYGGPSGGFEQPTGYDSRSGYVPGPEGYAGPAAGGRSPQGGYDDPGYYGAEQPPPSGRRAAPDGGQAGQRRPLDWLDD